MQERRRRGIQAQSVLSGPNWAYSQRGCPAFLVFGLVAIRWTTYRGVFRRFLLTSHPCPAYKLRLRASIADTHSMPDRLQHSCRSS
jgi:hypothetical protein